jgi:hypothetical protein
VPGPAQNPARDGGILISRLRKHQSPDQSGRGFLKYTKPPSGLPRPGGLDFQVVLAFPHIFYPPHHPRSTGTFVLFRAFAQSRARPRAGTMPLRGRSTRLRSAATKARPYFSGPSRPGGRSRSRTSLPAGPDPSAPSQPPGPKRIFVSSYAGRLAGRPKFSTSLVENTAGHDTLDTLDTLACAVATLGLAILPL